MKTDWAKNLSALMADVPKKEFNEDAIALSELSDRLKMSVSQCSRIAHRNVMAGKWRKVWKHIEGKPSPAYLPVKK